MSTSALSIRMRRMKLRYILAAAIFIGVAFRIGTDVPVFITELVYQPPAGGIIPSAGNPENTVKRFFMLADNGRYEEAWDLVIEPDWVEADRPAPYRSRIAASAGSYQGLVSKDEFCSRLTGEMGPKGIFLSLSHIKASELKAEPLSLPFPDIVEYPEYSDAYMFKARGDYLASCAIYRWEKVLPVLKTADGYKIVLEGTKNAKENYYLIWLNFAEKKLIKSLRGTPKEGAL